jgi:excisionase family DNA binding protein
VNPSTAHTSTTPDYLASPTSDAAILLDTETVAELLACTPRNVTRLITAGHLPAFRLGPGKSSWRVTAADLAAFIRRWGQHDPAHVAEVTDPNRLTTRTRARLTTRRTPDGLLLVGLQPPDPDA